MISWYLSFSDCLSVSGSTHVAADGIISLFLWLSNTPLCICAILYPLSVDGCLGRFHVSAIVNSAAVNIGCVNFFKFVFIFSKYLPRRGISGSYGILVFLGNLLPVLFSGRSVHSHQQCFRVPLSSPPSSAFICRLFDDDRSDWYEVVPHHSFDLWYWASFLMAFGHLYVFGEMMFRSSHFYDYGVFFGCWAACRLHNLQIFSPIL